MLKEAVLYTIWGGKHTVKQREKQVLFCRFAETEGDLAIDGLGIVGDLMGMAGLQ